MASGHTRRQTTWTARAPRSELRNIRRFRTIPFFAAEASPAALRRLEADPAVATIEEDAADVTSLAQSVPRVGGPAAWAAGFSASGWTVAIVDTGVDAFHPFLDGKVVSEACYSNAGGAGGGISLCPGRRHARLDGRRLGGALRRLFGLRTCGTHVAGIAAGRGGSFSGVGRDATVMAIQAFTGFPRTARRAAAPRASRRSCPIRSSRWSACSRCATPTGLPPST